VRKFIVFIGLIGFKNVPCGFICMQKWVIHVIFMIDMLVVHMYVGHVRWYQLL